ncbi:LysM peptidoglycan-binding domain-containing protein, partial [Xenorhabdus bovienii]
SGLSLTSVRAYNPGYKQGMTSPHGPHYIMLPKQNVSQFKTSLTDENVLKDIRLSVTHNARKLQQQGQYTVRAGDTLSAIAKRFNTT